jgi:hypothetical protein
MRPTLREQSPTDALSDLLSTGKVHELVLNQQLRIEVFQGALTEASLFLARKRGVAYVVARGALSKARFRSEEVRDKRGLHSFVAEGIVGVEGGLELLIAVFGEEVAGHIIIIIFIMFKQDAFIVKLTQRCL